MKVLCVSVIKKSNLYEWKIHTANQYSNVSIPLSSTVTVYHWYKNYLCNFHRKKKVCDNENKKVVLMSCRFRIHRDELHILYNWLTVNKSIIYSLCTTAFTFLFDSFFLSLSLPSARIGNYTKIRGKAQNTFVKTNDRTL